jgi:hypothetical protein
MRYTDQTIFIFASSLMQQCIAHFTLCSETDTRGGRRYDGINRRYDHSLPATAARLP